jgi:hypothetical protein
VPGHFWSGLVVCNRDWLVSGRCHVMVCFSTLTGRVQPIRGCVWTIMNVYKPVWTCVRVSGGIWSCPVLFGRAWSCVIVSSRCLVGVL